MQCPLAIVVPVGPMDSSWRILLQDLDDLLPDPLPLVFVACDELNFRRIRSVAEKTRISAEVILSEQGRAQQMNLGAEAVRSEFLLFIHSDSRLHSETALALKRFCLEIDSQRFFSQQERNAFRNRIWFFRLRFLKDGPRIVRINERLGNWRARWFGIPSGTQGLLMSKELFQNLHGFQENLLGISEDIDLVLRARRKGVHLVEMNAPLMTSSRTFRQRGWLRTTASHLKKTVQTGIHSVFRKSA